MRRIALLTAAVTFALASVCASAQENKLPDIGSSAAELLTPAKQREYGSMMLAQLRHYDYLLEDPLIDSWLDTLGTRLAANSDKPRQPFTFFMLRERQINAFATLGGYIGVNSGLVLTAEKEDEVAAVISHEIAHVTQQHVLRGVERAQRDQLPILLAMLGAIVAAQAAGEHSQDDATMAAITSGLGLMQQRQINYTRSNESEADRIGIQTLSRSNYDTSAMAGFFQRMQVVSRSNAANWYGETPDYLMTHPVTTTRISEAKERAEQLANKNSLTAITSTPNATRVERIPKAPFTLPPNAAGTDNPLLPNGLKLSDQALTAGGTGVFDFARERVRVMSANSPREAVREYEKLAGDTDAQRYGLALARMRANQTGAAITSLTELLNKHPDQLWLSLALGEAEALAGKTAAADARFEALLRQTPSNRAIALTYAKVLTDRSTAASGQRAQAILRPLFGAHSDDPLLQQTYARACEIAGDSIRAGEAYAEAAYLRGRPEQALVQLNTLKRKPDLDYYARARIEARIAAITPTVLELKRQGVRDEDLKRQ